MLHMRSGLAGLLCLLGWACSGSAERPGVAPRHAVLITISGLRADHCSSYLYVRPTTAWSVDPGQVHMGRNLAIDDLAETGVSFSSAFSAVADTLGSLAAIHTGRAPAVGQATTELAQESTTLAESLRGAGMRTVAFVAGPNLEQVAGLDQGFDFYVHAPSDAQVLAKAVPWVKEQDWSAAHGTFLWIHLSGPEPPFEPFPLPPMPGKGADGLSYADLFLLSDTLTRKLVPRDYRKIYSDPEYKGEASGGWAWLQQRSDPKLPRPEPADLQHVIDLYDGEVAVTSSLLRSFLLALRELTDAHKFWDSTALVLVGVTGAELFEHGTYAQTVHAPSVRVPLILRHAASLTGSRVLARPVDTTDITPTLLEWMGVDPRAKQWNRTRARRDGRSLLALVDSYTKKPFDARSVVGLGPRGAGEAVMRDERWSLLWRPRADGEIDFALYDRDLDPHELRDLSLQQPERTARMKTELTELFAAKP